MDIRTHCLNILCMLLLIYPAATSNIFSNFFFNYIYFDKKKRDDSFWLFNIIISIVIIYYISIFQHHFLSLHDFRIDISITLGIIISPFLIILEIIVGALAIIIQGRKIKTLTVTENIGIERFFIKISILLISIFEELLFRKYCFALTTYTMGFSVLAFLCISATLYSTNHIHNGFITAIQKFFTGFALGLIFIISNYNLLVPIISHLCENIFIMIWSSYSHEK